MSRKGVVKALAVWTAGYHRNLDDATIHLYIEHLEDIDDGLLEKVTTDLLLRSKFFPSIAEIREHAAITLLGDGLPPSSSAAWGEIAKAISSHGRHHRPHWSHPLVGLILEEVGGYWEACMSSNLESIRIRFQSAFDKARKETIANVAVAKFDYGETPKAITAKNRTQIR
jgi:hypothetical protein